MNPKIRIMEEKSFKETIRRWKTSDFLRQLASVIIGILITFGGSTLIQRCSERREVAQVLSMVRDELQINLHGIERQKEYRAHDFAGAKAIRPYVDSPESMPVDSLYKYINVFFGDRSYFGCLTNSLEVLKNSEQIHYIRNKKLIRDLFMVYENMKNFQESTKEFHSQRIIGFNDYIVSGSSDITESVLTDPSVLPKAFAEGIKTPSVRQFIIYTDSGNNGIGFILRLADQLITDITKVINMIDKETGH